MDGQPPWQWSRSLPAPPYLDEVIGRWGDLAALPGSVVLKSNASREVIALAATPTRPSLIAKRYHVRPRERWKYLLWPSRARAEWRALAHLRSAGVSVPCPLAAGERRRGPWLVAGGLIMERITDARSLPAWLETCEDPARRAAVAEELGVQIARLHAAGCDHGDLHGGNVLVRTHGVPGKSQVVLLDHHVVRILGWLPGWRRLQNLSRLVHSIDDCWTRDEWLGFLAGYDAARDDESWGRERLAAFHEKLARRARRVERVRLRSRTRRCWLNTREFCRDRVGSLRVYRRREIPLAPIQHVLREMPALDPVYKERAGYRVGGLDLALPDGELAVVVKIHEHIQWWRRLLAVFQRGPLENAWETGRAFDVRGLPNPRSLALCVERRHGLPWRSVLFTERVVHSRTLHEDLLERLWPPGTRDRSFLRRRIRAVAALVRDLHDFGIYHRDLNPANFLVVQESNGQPEQLYVVDLDSVRRCRLTGRRRRKNLVQIGLLPEGHITPRDRLRFLHDYDRGEQQAFTRKEICALDRQMTAEIVQILARLSEKEARAEDPRQVGDPFFGRETRARDGA